MVSNPADCGVSSPSATLGLNYGSPCMLIGLSQRLGCCGRAKRKEKYPSTNSYYPKIWIVRYKHVPVTVESVTIQKFWIVTESISSF